MLGPPAVEIGTFRAEGGHFDVASFLRAKHDDHPETRSHCQRSAVSEQTADGVGTGVRGDVVILRDATHEKVANAPTVPERSEAGSLQPPHHVNGKLTLGIGDRHAADSGSAALTVGVKCCNCQAKQPTLAYERRHSPAAADKDSRHESLPRHTSSPGNS